MPWKPSDAESHTQAADTDEKRKVWAEVANERLEACLETHPDDRSEEQIARCEASAIRQANAAIRKMSAGEGDLVEAATLKTKAQRLMRDADEVLKDKSLPAGLRKEIEDVRAALKKTWDDLGAEADGEQEEGMDRQAHHAMEEQKKMVDGKEYPSSDFLVVEDEAKPSTWSLQVKRNGKPDHGLMGGAFAALTKGYRGNKYEGPQKADAIRKLKALYKSEDMEVPAAEYAMREQAHTFAALRAVKQTESAIAAVQELTYQFQSLALNILYDPEIGDRIAPLRELADEYLGLVEAELSAIGSRETAQQVAPESVIEACEMAEADTGSIISITESQSVEDAEPSPLTLDVVVIEPGWGNTKDNHYYSREMLQQYASAFTGAKMYATNHKDEEKSVLTEVSQVLECPVSFTETGAPVARVGVFDDGFAANIRNRAALGKLEDLHVSILANGTARPYEENGRKGKYVETISTGASVDWVTRAGAGGHALRLAENEQEAVMEEEIKVEAPAEEPEVKPEEQPTETVQTAETQPEPVVLSEAEVQTALKETKLPDVSREKLAKGQYADAAELQTAVVAEAEYVAALTGAGRPVGMVQPAQPAQQPSDGQAYQARLDEIDKRYGLLRQPAKIGGNGNA
jgi:hypothetical protein